MANDFGDAVGNIDINESIQETHSIVTSNCNKKQMNLPIIMITTH